VLSVEEQKYYNFAKLLLGAGVNTVAQIISKATAVRLIEAFHN
jgi:hypothetical protein